MNGPLPPPFTIPTLRSLFILRLEEEYEIEIEVERERDDIAEIHVGARKEIRFFLFLLFNSEGSYPPFVVKIASPMNNGSPWD